MSVAPPHRPVARAQPIVALDVGTAAAALALVHRLGARCRFYKVGSELFTAEGPAVVRAILDAGADVFLDLKFHDIPATVAGAVRSAAALGARLVTVHASGGEAMLAEAARSAAGTGCAVLAVTVLTSLDEALLGAAWGRPVARVEEEVRRLAGVAAGAGVHGVVCSGGELAAVREAFPELAVLVPGVRFAGGEAHDQRRVVTPARAQALGARYVVLGRAVTAAPSPEEAMVRALAELGGAGGAGL